MMLVEAGKLKLDDKIAEHLTGLPEAWANVTVRHLLTHTSGIKGYTEVPDFAKITMHPATAEDVVRAVSSYPLQFKPGEDWAYSNTGYYLLGRIIEKAGGATYGAFLRERIFDPLHMDSTRVNDRKAVIRNRAAGYSWDRGSQHNADYVDMSWPFAAGAIISSVNDLAKWDAALGSERLLKAASWEQMWTPVKLTSGTPREYGFGWHVGDINGHKVIDHGGGIPGFTSFVARYPDDRLTVIVLANQERAPAGKIARQVAGLYVPDLTPTGYKPIEDKHPEVAALLKGVLAETTEGKLAEKHFTPKFWAELSEHAGELADLLKPLGPLETIQLVERKDAGAGGVNYRYRAKFRDGAILFLLTLADDGKIAGLRLEPE
jgi:CubicO group peptidase (beta-lactamase class C family)